MKHIVHRRANPSVADVLRLANVFNVSVAELTSREAEGASRAADAASVRRYDPERFSAAFGGRLRAFRERRGMSIRPLAKLSDISRNTLRLLETGDAVASTRIVTRVARGLGITFWDLVESLHASVLSFAPIAPLAGPGARELLRDSGAGDILRMEELRLRTGDSVERAACSPGAVTMAYAVEGSILVVFDADMVALKAGEAALVASDREFVISCAGRRPAVVLMVVRTADPESIEPAI